MRLVVTAQAEQDLLDIWAYIASANVPAADRLFDAIEAACAMLTDFPRLGPAFSPSPALRYLSVGRYLVLYQALKGAVKIVRVVHGARYLPGIVEKN